MICDKGNNITRRVGICHRFDHDENLERGNWTRKLDFLLSLTGYAVGLGNIWRFPYKLYDHGASFLIPYGIMLILAGIPLFFMEMSLGQFSSHGPISLWKVSPLFKGLGWAMVIISFLVCIYYNMIIAYTIYYMFSSMNTDLPWSTCTEEWIRKYCCISKNANETMRNFTRMQCANLSTYNDSMKNDLYSPKSPSVIYWEYVVLQRSSSIYEGSANINLHLAICLLATWVITFFALCRGIKSSVKVVYFTATLPFVMMVIILIKNTTLPGAVAGIKFYVVPKFEKLKELKVWYSAATQVFYTLGIGFGGLQTMASYNRFHNNVYSDSVLVPIVNCVASLTAGLVIFTAMGFISHETGRDISDAVKTGPGLAFVLYPTGLAMMPLAPLWSVCFFTLLCTLGIDSQLGMMETIISAISDEFNFEREEKKRVVFTFCLCTSMFLLGLPQCAMNGAYIVNLFDWYTASFSLMTVSLIEVVAVLWIYGWKSLCKDIEMMTGSSPNIYWRSCWVVFSPILITFILVVCTRDYISISHNTTHYDYTEEMDYLGIFIGCSPLIPILICAGIEIRKHYSQAGILQAIKKSAKPAGDWGPHLDIHRDGSRYAPLRRSRRNSILTQNSQLSSADHRCPCYTTTEVNVRISVTTLGEISRRSHVTSEHSISVSHM